MSALSGLYRGKREDANRGSRRKLTAFRENRGLVHNDGGILSSCRSKFPGESTSVQCRPSTTTFCRESPPSRATITTRGLRRKAVREEKSQGKEKPQVTLPQSFTLRAADSLRRLPPTGPQPPRLNHLGLFQYSQLSRFCQCLPIPLPLWNT